jgi:ribosomal protein S20
MPIKKSAKKALRKSKRRWVINQNRKKKIKTSVKNFMQSLKAKDVSSMKDNLSKVYKQLDKAGKTFIHKNKVARLKSRYAKLLRSIS